MNFSDAVDLFERNATISFFTFSNSIIPPIYKIIFGSTMPRISEDLKLLLHNPTELIGDWFFYQDFTVIKVYGFEGISYKLPKFLTRRLLVWEFLRQRLSVENENFIKHKKVSSIKFKFTLQPFEVESVYVVTIIDQIMEIMKLQTYKSLRYDPRKVIHQRKIDVNLKGYEADHDEVLDALANTDLLEQMGDDDKHSNNSDIINPDKAVEGHITKVPTPLKGEKPLKRHSIDTTDMDIDVTIKKPRVFVQSKEIDDLEEDDEQSINKGKDIIVEEEHNDQSQTMSNSERSSSHLAMVEANKEPTIMFQRFAMDQAEAS